MPRAFHPEPLLEENFPSPPTAPPSPVLLHLPPPYCTHHTSATCIEFNSGPTPRPLDPTLPRPYPGYFQCSLNKSKELSRVLEEGVLNSYFPSIFPL